MNLSVGFIGGGRVVRIILSALWNSNVTFKEISSYDPDEKVLEKLRTMYPNVKTFHDNLSFIPECDIVFLAVHPPAIPDVFKSLKIMKENVVFVSLAPKLKIKQIEEHLNGFNRIVRMIPNASSCIGQGFNPIAVHKSFDIEGHTDLRNLFEVLGEYPVVDEDLLEAYAIITAMGPTYFWPQINKLKELAISFGIEKKTAEEAISKMLAGSVRALFDSGLSPETVMDLVPVYPLKEIESQILEEYQNKLSSLFEKLKK